MAAAVAAAKIEALAVEDDVDAGAAATEDALETTLLWDSFTRSGWLLLRVVDPLWEVTEVLGERSGSN